MAHGSAVNCLQLGRKSGTVMVTGGDDKKVNVWAVGKPNAIMSLAGHTSAVECVSFDSNEQTVIAGSAGGTLKLWDLEQAKVARTLTGHRSNCVSVQVRTRRSLHAFWNPRNRVAQRAPSLAHRGQRMGQFMRLTLSLHAHSGIRMVNSLRLAPWTPISKFGISGARRVSRRTRATHAASARSSSRPTADG